MDIIGRSEEIVTLTEILNSTQAEFLAIYGRRRIGKTFLIREFFSKQKSTFFFDCYGQKNAKPQEQIQNFCHQMRTLFKFKYNILTPNNWKDVFHLFAQFLEERKEKKIVIFIDELPWFSSPKSNFLQTLDFFWNQSWSKNSKIKLIVCGSAASWMSDHLIQAKGGLHNRLTRQIRLQPFSFKEICEFSKSKKLKLNTKELLSLFMTFGGIPYYWSLMKKGKSAAQLIDDLYFNDSAELKAEFSVLFKSLFDDYEHYEKIIRTIGKYPKGLDRNSILEKCKIKTGGTANNYLRNLETSGFIESFIPWGNKKKHITYRLVDEFCLFHLFWEGQHSTLQSFWANKQSSPQVNTWAGFAFENFCFHHRQEITKALKIEHLVLNAESWRHISPKNSREEKGAQIDLFFVRKDQCINILEIKYSKSPYVIDKQYAKALLEKKEIFIKKTKFKGQVFISLLSPEGVQDGLWNDEVIDSTISLKDFL